MFNRRRRHLLDSNHSDIYKKGKLWFFFWKFDIIDAKLRHVENNWWSETNKITYSKNIITWSLFYYMNSRNSNLWVFTIENPIASRKKGLFALDLMTNPHVIFCIQNNFSNSESCKIRIHSFEFDERCSNRNFVTTFLAFNHFIIKVLIIST